MSQQEFKAIKSKLIEDGNVQMVEPAARGGADRFRLTDTGRSIAATLKA
jgi:hypothetical protein